MKKDKEAKKPVEKGKVYDLKVISEGEKGDGVAYYGESNFVIFVKKAKFGEKGKVRIQEVYNHSAVGVMEEKNNEKE